MSSIIVQRQSGVNNIELKLLPLHDCEAVTQRLYFPYNYIVGT